MFPEGTLIYSRHSRRDALLKKLKEQDFDRDFEPEEPSEPVKLVLKPRPERIASSPGFIEAAKSWATRFDIGMSIYENADAIVADIYMAHSCYSAECAHGLAGLIQMSDRICTDPGSGDKFSFVLTLEYDTHTRYIDDKIINI